MGTSSMTDHHADLLTDTQGSMGDQHARVHSCCPDVQREGTPVEQSSGWPSERRARKQSCQNASTHLTEHGGTTALYPRCLHADQPACKPHSLHVARQASQRGFQPALVPVAVLEGIQPARTTDTRADIRAHKQGRVHSCICVSESVGLHWSVPSGERVDGPAGVRAHVPNGAPANMREDYRALSPARPPCGLSVWKQTSIDSGKQSL